MAVAYTQETASRASAWLAASDSKRRTRPHTQELHAIYALITGNPAQGCISCGFSHYVDLLTAYVNHFNRLTDPTLMADSQYTFAPGFENETFVHESYTKAVKADNITDADGEFIAKHMPHLVLKGGKAIEAAKAVAEGDEAPQPKLKADWQKRYQEVVGTEADKALTIPQLEAAITEKQAELDAARD